MKTKLIRNSTDRDLKEILSWLKDQDQADIDDTFYCHKNFTINSHKEGKLLVYIDPDTNKAIAYQWGGLLTPGILEVRVNKRGQGIGKKMVEYCINEARINNKCLLQIQCQPFSSIPFWKHMGFRLYSLTDAYMILSKKHNLPIDGIAIPVTINFYPERRKWDKDALPIETFTPYAVQNPSNYICFSERIIYFDSNNNSHGDIVISINVDGKLVYLDKAKYEEALELGVHRDYCVFYLDKIKYKEPLVSKLDGLLPKS